MKVNDFFPGLFLRPISLRALPTLPLVSVLVTCHNYAQYVGECIASVTKQSYRNLELIVADDGSTDDSIEVVSGLAAIDNRVQLVGGKHQGMAAALNLAWNQCRGEIICLLDADDYFTPGKIEQVVRAFQANADSGYLIHRALRIDSVGRPRGVLPLLSKPLSGWCASQVLKNGGVMPNVPPTSNLSFRREIGERIFPLPDAFQGYAEQVIQRIAPLLTKVINLDEVLAVWRLHGANDGNTAHLQRLVLEREVSVMEQLWEVQRHFLETAAPDSVSALEAVNRSDYYCRLRYTLARGQSPPEAVIWHSHLLESLGFADRPRVERWFWRIAPFLPNPLFGWMVKMVMTQSRSKELIAAIRRTYE